VAGKAVQARQKTARMTSTAKTQLQARTSPLRQAAPEPVRHAAAKGASAARRRPALVIATAGALIAGGLALLRWRKR